MIKGTFDQMDILTKAVPLMSPEMLGTPDQKGELREVAEQFEAIFINQMLKQMRQSKLADGILDNQANETYSSMLDAEQSKHLAGSIDFGIAEALVRQLGKGKGVE